MDLAAELARVFPFARRVAITVPLGDDGTFVAELVLPVRAGESEVQLYRHPIDDRRLDELLAWPDRVSTGNGAWGWLVAWDGVASGDEIRELVTKRVIRHPAIGDPSN